MRPFPATQRATRKELARNGVFRRPAIGEFWLAAIPAYVLLRSTASDPLRVIIDADFDADDEDNWKALAKEVAGNQRLIEVGRLKDIAGYINTVDSTFPNSVILAAASEGDDQEKRQPWRVEESKGIHRLVIPKNARLASVVDGQHRLYAFAGANSDRKATMHLVCSIFFDMPKSEQAFVFATINSNQRQVRRGLALNMYGYNADDEDRSLWAPDKLGVFIARRLNWDEASKLYNRIKVEAANAPTPEFLPGASRAVAMAAVVDGVLGLISRRPRDDRDFLRTSSLLTRPNRSKIKDDGTPLRGWYRASADKEIYAFVRSCVAAFSEAVWDSKQDTGTMLARAVGIRALFAFVASVARDGLGTAADPPSRKKLDEFEGRTTKALNAMLRMGTSRIDFSDSFFEATGRGSVRMRNALMLANERADLNDMPAGDREEYQRVLKATPRQRGST